MKRGQLSEYISGQAAKRLSAVEAQPARSNQHEFNGVAQLAAILGPAVPRRTFVTRFVYLDDIEERVVSADGSVTWYDARERHPTRSEARLYFTSSPVSEAFRAGDLLAIAIRRDGSLLIAAAAKGTTSERQLLWLLGLDEVAEGRFDVHGEEHTDRIPLNYSSRRILEELGIEIARPGNGWLEQMLRRFEGKFPSTKDFSAYARSTLRDINARENADAVLLAWLEREEMLFRTLERHIVAQRLKEGFGEDAVDDFVAYSLAVQNRRKARAGRALQNHVETIVRARSIRFTAQGLTEHRSMPDFLFPGVAEYHDPKFPVELLTMLGVKSSCKDRWRQVLAEADRIAIKHLLTLEPGISTTQIDEMKSKQVQLVVPAPIHPSYPATSTMSIWDLEQFLRFVAARQAWTT